MAKRFYFCPIVGDGTENNPYRPKIAHYNVNWSAPMPSNADGSPKFGWTIAIVGAQNHTPMVDDVDLDGVPELSLDVTLSVLTNAQRTTLLGFLQKRNIDTSGMNVNTTLRQVIQAVGDRLEIGFRTERFDCRDG